MQVFRHVFSWIRSISVSRIAFWGSIHGAGAWFCGCVVLDEGGGLSEVAGLYGVALCQLVLCVEVQVHLEALIQVFKLC